MIEAMSRRVWMLAGALTALTACESTPDAVMTDGATDAVTTDAVTTDAVTADAVSTDAVTSDVPATPADVVAAGDGAVATPFGGSAVYFVPPRGPTTTYEVGSVTWTIEGDVVHLGYGLPRLLLGEMQRVTFRGTYTPGAAMTLTSADGTATCTLDPSPGVALRCEERFTGLTVDLEGVRREALRVDPTQVDARVMVSQRFSIEPIGVLEVPTR